MSIARAQVTGHRLQGLIFVISGPSGSGKTTLLEKLLNDRQAKKLLVKSISLTTRPKRSTEVNKKDYFFISESKFKNWLKAKKILEWTKYLGYYYATPRDFIESQISKGKHIALCLDYNGAKAIKRAYPTNTVSIFVIPPSLAALRKRIEGRCVNTKEEEIKWRLRLAKKEISFASKYNYSLKNNNFQQALNRLRHIILSEIKNRINHGGRNG